jgi:hypothetical protein
MFGSKYNSTTFLGKVYEPCTCCDPLFYVYDSNQILRWKIHTEYCQCGVCYRGGIGRCHEVIFPIYPSSVEEFDPKFSNGFVKKRFGGLKDLYTDADDFELHFPETATPEERFMLIGAVLMIDYNYYEDKGGQE